MNITAEADDLIIGVVNDTKVSFHAGGSAAGLV